MTDLIAVGRRMGSFQGQGERARQMLFFAEKGAVKDTIWNVRLSSLGLEARIDIPVAGRVFNVVNDTHPLNSWPTPAETGWQEYHDKADKTFDAIVKEMAGAAFNKTIFEGSAASQAFEWHVCMERRWSRRYHNFRNMSVDRSDAPGWGALHKTAQVQNGRPCIRSYCNHAQSASPGVTTLHV